MSKRVKSKFPVKIELKDCKICIVGEAPGASEELAGEPFVGRAGQLLTLLLTEAGIDRDECYITNVFKERPKDNKVEEFFVSRHKLVLNNNNLVEWGPSLRNMFLKEEYRSALPDLHREITGVNPAVIIVLGAVPLWALTGASDISNKRGTIQKFGEVSVVPTFHPAYLLRGNMGHKVTCVNDLRLAKKIADDNSS